MQNPRCSSSTSASSTSCRALAGCASTASTTHGTHFIIGRTIGSVFNPVVGGPDRVVNLESSVNTKYDALLVCDGASAADELRLPRVVHAGEGVQLRQRRPDPVLERTDRSERTCSKEYGPTPNDQRHRFTLAGVVARAAGDQRLADLDDRIGRADGHPDARRASRAFRPSSATPAAASSRSPSELNALSARVSTPAAASTACRCRSSAPTRVQRLASTPLDLRVSRPFGLGRGAKIEPMLEVFNVFNITNILGTSNRENYSGFSNVLVRDSSDPSSPAS